METTTEATEAADEGKSSPQFTCDFDPGKMPTSYFKIMITELRDRDDIP